MYNPFVGEQEIQSFLQRYCSFVSAGVKQTNVLGTFNGLRRYYVQFRAGGVAGVDHPPQAFSISVKTGEYCGTLDNHSIAAIVFSSALQGNIARQSRYAGTAISLSTRLRSVQWGKKCHYCSSE